MLYEQFLKEVAIDFKSLYQDFETELLITGDVRTFEEYFRNVVNNGDMIEEIIIEAERFGVKNDLFKKELYNKVKNFNGLIENRINQLQSQIDDGYDNSEQLFEAKTASNLLKQSLS
ncbi:hypothetical protein BTS2_1549 [Bacillus sp. TS-2]|nr:hypothetical protein BTS2_1549 [Bacillus sp. TS-2]